MEGKFYLLDLRLSVVIINTEFSQFLKIRKILITSKNMCQKFLNNYLYNKKGMQQNKLMLSLIKYPVKKYVTKKYCGSSWCSSSSELH